MDSMGGDVESREKIDREPRMHIMADLSKEKFSLHLSQCNVELYGLPCFSAKREASLLYTTVAMVPMPPAAEKTNGEKEPFPQHLRNLSAVFLHCYYSVVFPHRFRSVSAVFPHCSHGVSALLPQYFRSLLLVRNCSIATQQSVSLV